MALYINLTIFYTLANIKSGHLNKPGGENMKRLQKNIEVIARSFILVGNKVLLCKMKGESWYFLPGGHVNFEERAEETLLREIKEELGIPIRLESFVGAVENIYTENRERHHEINLIFLANAKKIILKSKESHIEFALKDIESLATENILPENLKAALLEWLKSKKIFWRSGGVAVKKKEGNKETEISLFICFEGIAGSGKTTQSILLKQRLEKENLGEVIISKAYEEEKKRSADFLINALKISPDSVSMMFLFQVLHSEQYEETKEALEKGKIVIADRWRESFWAWHLNFGPLAKEPRKTLEILDQLAFHKLEPEITFLLNLPVEVAIKRFLSRDRESILYPRLKPYESFTILRDYYLRIARRKKWTLIDANRSIKEVHESIWRELSPIFEGIRQV